MMKFKMLLAFCFLWGSSISGHSCSSFFSVTMAGEEMLIPVELSVASVSVDQENGFSQVIHFTGRSTTSIKGGYLQVMQIDPSDDRKESACEDYCLSFSYFDGDTVATIKASWGRFQIFGPRTETSEMAAKLIALWKEKTSLEHPHN